MNDMGLLSRGLSGGSSGHFYVVGALVDMISPGLKTITANVGVTNNILTKEAMRMQRVVHASNMALNSFGAVASGVIAGTTAMAFGFGAAAKQVIEFERELVNMNSILDKDESVMWGLGNEAIELSKKYNKSADEIASGMYHLASAGLSAAEAK